MEKYDPKKIEKEAQKFWESIGLYKTDESSEKPKYYCLDMFPYPSGSGLHVGHWRGYVLSDIIARYQMLNGKNVLHPMGFDAFGLPAENAAIKEKSHPKVFTDKAIANFKKQLKQIGTCFDWSREINTSDPSYYKWTQWLFLQLYKNGLAYRKKAPVNWCPSCQTVLANEQVVSGECERCGSKVIKKDLTQWFFKITDFADELLKDLDGLDWPERTKNLQRNWIGKSEGTLIKFEILNTKCMPEGETNPKSQIKNSKQYIEVFTTRADTLFGCTYVVLSPEHELVNKLKIKAQNISEVEEYIKKVKNISDIERLASDKEKTGVELKGIKAVNPINNEQIPVFISDYVLTSYGTGAVMAVPAHDERDFEFAKKYNLPIRQTLTNDKKIIIKNSSFDEYGVLINSSEFDRLDSKEAIQKITEKLKNDGSGDFMTTYKLRDWLISRQRYWGAPIPVIYCSKCLENPKSEIRNPKQETTEIDGIEYAIVPVSEDQLPILLPEDVEFTPHGDSPLKKSDNFVNTTCPKCGGKAKRETDTMDTFVCSSWYYLRYADHDNDKQFASSDKLNKWLPVDLYVGGIEHAVLHLLYARFVSKALHKLKLLNFNASGEPFQKLFNIGMIYLHGAKMSKSKGNVVSPDELIEKYGADALRGYELFIGPADLDSEWQVLGISGISRFLEKAWNVLNSQHNDNVSKDPMIEKKIMIVTSEIESFRPNTAISHLMELFNYLKNNALSKNNAKNICIIMAPFFPHFSEAVWMNLGEKESIFKSNWPEYDRNIINENEITIAIQINGKLKNTITIKKDLEQSEVETLVKNDPKISEIISGKKIIKIIYVSGRILNFVVE